jgi:biopolymer transport protein ExbD
MSYPVSKSNQKKILKSRGNRNLKAFKPHLTSLIDIMTILLIFLLKSFSSEGQIISVSPELMLPESSAEKLPNLTVVIKVNNNYIMVEDSIVAIVDAVLASEELIITGLYEWLGTRREMTSVIEQHSTNTKFTGTILIEGDKRIRFRLLKKIMYTCGKQQYNNFSLLVQKKED